VDKVDDVAFCLWLLCSSEEAQVADRDEGVHRAVWKSQARAEALKALSLSGSELLHGRSKSFVYVQNERRRKRRAQRRGSSE